MMEICLIYHIHLIKFSKLPCYDERIMNKVRVYQLPITNYQLSITNPGTIDLEPLGGFIARSIKRVPRTHRDSVVTSKLSP